MAVITLTTDFGTRDGYVGAMKGVIERVRAGKSTVVDLAHDIPRGDIAHAAWVVSTATREFPESTIHVVVVDPGVGGPRRGVVVRDGGMLYVGPDNGVFAYLAPRRGNAIENTKLLAPAISPTFHGRDVFAHVAAALDGGLDRYEVGDPVELTGRLPWGPRPSGEGRVVHVDHFGNLITDLPAAEAGATVAIATRRLSIVGTYLDAAPGELLAYIGSAGTVEIAVRDGRADRALDAPRGTRIVPVAAGSEFR